MNRFPYGGNPPGVFEVRDGRVYDTWRLPGASMDVQDVYTVESLPKHLEYWRQFCSDRQDMIEAAQVALDRLHDLGGSK